MNKIAKDPESGEREKVSAVHIENDFCSFVKGYWNFVTNKGSKLKENEHIIQCKSIMNVICISCVIIFLICITKLAFENYTNVFEDETSEKPDNFNEQNGDYCVEDDNGKIITCIRHLSNIAKYLLAPVLLLITGCVSFILLVFCGAIIMGIGYAIQFVRDFTLSIPLSLDKYNQYREKIKKDVSEQIVEII